MKTTLLTTLSWFLTTALIAQNYYWVGDGGNWSDLTHWATTSGGSELHEALPTELNDVYFDMSSFTLPGQIVVIDLPDVFCRDFNTAGVDHQAQIVAQAFEHRLNVSGDFNLTADMGRSLNRVAFTGSDEVQIFTGELSLGMTSNLQFLTDADYFLNDSTSVSQVNISNGRFHTQGNPVHARLQFRTVNANSETGVFLSHSNISTKAFSMENDVEVDASMSTIRVGITENILDGFSGGGHHYHHVIFNHNIHVSGLNTFDLFEVLPGAHIRLSDESWQGAGQFVLFGTPDEQITIATDYDGETAYFEQSTGLVNGSHLILQNVHALGEAEFTAHESEDLGNNVGWQFGGEEDEEVGVAPLQGHLHLKPYPNPANVQFTCHTQNGEDYGLFDASGRLIQQFQASGTRSSIDVSRIAEGVYYLKHLSGETVTEKVVVSR